MAEPAEEPKYEADPSDTKKIVHTYPLIQECDMLEEVKSEAMEQIVNACEKHGQNLEAAARMIKDIMDKKFGASWHVVVGEAYGLNITYQCSNMMYMFFGGYLAVCIWKCS